MDYADSFEKYVNNVPAKFECRVCYGEFILLASFTPVRGVLLLAEPLRGPLWF